jgi:sigma-B regulation protein RsbU (phosphoserine phosphatase)
MKTADEPVMHEQLKQAARVHYSFLPEHYEDDWLDVATRLTPKLLLGGDYCSVMPLGGQRFAACICDAVGHGLASALYAARINTFVLTNILQGQDPCELISALNEFLCCRLIESGMYATFFVVLLDTGNMQMRFAGAGHPAALHLTAVENQVHWLESQTTLLGFEHPLPVHCPLQTCPISSGDRILLYTDGLTEARNRRGEEFGCEGLAAYVSNNTQLGNRDFVNGLCETVHEYSKGDLHDDILCLSIQLK